MLDLAIWSSPLPCEPIQLGATVYFSNQTCQVFDSPEIHLHVTGIAWGFTYLVPECTHVNCIIIWHGFLSCLILSNSVYSVNQESKFSFYHQVQAETVGAMNLRNSFHLWSLFLGYLWDAYYIFCCTVHFFHI